MDTPFKDFPFKDVLSFKPLIDYLRGLGSDGRNMRPRIKKEIDELLEQARKFAANGVFTDDVCLVGMDYIGPNPPPAS